MSASAIVCVKCVMDTTDPNIAFDGSGVCNHCREYEERVKRQVASGGQGRRILKRIVEKIKEDGANREYDCIIGVSGGVDSTFVAYKVKGLGLRPLAVHLDNGWDSELAVKNIQNVLELLDIDLYTYVLDWEEFKDLQLSFLKASTPDSEIPTDHAIVALLRMMTKKMRVRYIIMGSNVRTETHVPDAWSQGHIDWRYIRSVHRQFGSVPLRSFPHSGLWAFQRDRLTGRKWINILDYVDYVKRDAMQVLQSELGWKYYGGKHHESIYTRFYQGYILPRKFGYDKRKSHCSSLICSGEMTREEALKELKADTYPSVLQEEDRVYVIKKLGLTERGFDEIMRRPKKTYEDYPSYRRLYSNPVYHSARALYRRLRPAPSG